jgi:hypothetical protein
MLAGMLVMLAAGATAHAKMEMRTFPVLAGAGAQFGNLAVDLGGVRTARFAAPVADATGNGRRLARVLASRRVVGWLSHALAGSAMR